MPNKQRDEWKIDENLLDAQVAIDNSLADTTVAQALAQYGYDQARLQEGQSLQKEARELNNQQKAEYGDQFAATSEVQQAWSAAKKPYMKTLAIARVAFRQDPEAQTALMLRGNRKDSLSGWLGQARVFYSNLLGDARMMGLMANFNFDENKLRDEQALVQKLEDANLKQEKEKGEAQDATKVRDAALDALGDWMEDFREVAKVALMDNAQMLEKLGFNSQP